MVERKLENSNQSEENKIERGGRDYEFDCPICFELCVQPVLTPCNHFFCFQCEKEMLEKRFCCPLCRKKFEMCFVPVVDKTLQDKIQSHDWAAFEARKAELIKHKKWVGNKRLLWFSYGNTYWPVSQPAPAFPRSKICDIFLEHGWAIFVIFTTDREATSQYIKSVTFALPRVTLKNGEPCIDYKRRPIIHKIDHAPFILQ